MTPIQRTVMAMLVVAIIICAIALATAFYFLIQLGIDRSETMECYKLRAQSVEFSNNSAAAAFFLTKWQKEQCDSHGIFIQAPVK